MPALVHAGLVAAGLVSPGAFLDAREGSAGEAVEIAVACGGQAGLKRDP